VTLMLLPDTEYEFRFPDGPQNDQADKQAANVWRR
jgi:hypothetical protein